MPTSFGFRVENLTVDGHVEDSLRPGGECQRFYDMLIVVEKIRGRAHGAVEIVSGDAVLDVNHMHRGTSSKKATSLGPVIPVTNSLAIGETPWQQNQGVSNWVVLSDWRA